VGPRKPTNLDGRASISVLARRDGVGANPLHRWRCLMLEGASVAAADDDDVTRDRVVRRMDERIRGLGLGRPTMEVEILKEPLDRARPRKTDGARLVAAEARVPASVVARAPGVARSSLRERSDRRVEPRRRRHKAQDAVVAPLITALVAARPTRGCRRVAALLNGQLRADGAAPVNHKRVDPIIPAHGVLLARGSTGRPHHAHDGEVVTLGSCPRPPSGSNRWRLVMARRPDGFESAWLGTATSSAAPSSSTRTAGRSSPGGPWPTPGSAGRTSRT